MLSLEIIARILVERSSTRDFARVSARSRFNWSVLKSGIVQSAPFVRTTVREDRELCTTLISGHRIQRVHRPKAERASYPLKVGILKGKFPSSLLCRPSLSSAGRPVGKIGL